jgi:hypothetical protein
MSQGRFGNRPFEYKGFVHQVGQTVTFPSGFAKRELVLVEDPNANYKDYAAFEFLKTKNRDNTTLLDGLRKGQAVTVKFCLSANESKKSPGSWFGSARGIEVAADGGSQSEAPAPAEPEDDGLADADGLPF